MLILVPTLLHVCGDIYKLLFYRSILINNNKHKIFVHAIFSVFIIGTYVISFIGVFVSFFGWGIINVLSTIKNFYNYIIH